MPETSPGLLAKITGMRLRRQAGSDPPAQTPPGHTAIQGVEVWRETSSEEKEAILNVLPDSYFDPDFDALDHELSQAPLDVSAQALEAMAEERTTALEAVSEKLSHHIMRNYDAFAAGVQSVIAVEELVGSAKLRARISRERLAAASVDVQRGISVWQNTQRKRALSSLLEPLLNLRRAQELLTALRSALGRGNYREALRLCGRCLEVAEVLGPGINCSEGLLNAAGAALMDAIDQMRSVLSACATEFQPQQYHQVLQGYALLQEVDQFGVADEVHAGHDVRAAYAAAPAAAARKVVRGVLMARAGLEEKAARAQTLAELVDMLPSDLFRTCLARILMVAFDILEAYHQLEAWHRQPQHGSMKHDSKAGDGLDNGSRRGQLANGGSGSSGSRTEGEVSTVQQHETTAVESTASNSTSPRDEGCGSCYDSYSLQAVIDAVAEGLPGGRRLLWDEVSRAVSVLLGSPAAVDGEHFLQVLAWTQRLAAVGEAFSGAEAVPLRAVLNRQAGAFFRAFHQSNLEALNSMLEKEMWRRLPVDLPPLCDLGSGGEEGASAGRGSLGSGELAYQAFEDIVAAGNPWRRQKGE